MEHGAVCTRTWQIHIARTSFLYPPGPLHLHALVSGHTGQTRLANGMATFVNPSFFFVIFFVYHRIGTLVHDMLTVTGAIQGRLDTFLYTWYKVKFF